MRFGSGDGVAARSDGLEGGDRGRKKFDRVL
jgi:hypothetical protein